MNGDPVLFAALLGKTGPAYAFACTLCGRHYADEPDSVCPDCAKPAKTTRRPARKTTTAKR